MALRAGYYGVKRWLWDKLQSVPAKVDGLIDSNNITGAKNLIDVTQTIGGHSKAVISSITSSGFTVSTSESAANVASRTPLNLINGGKYILTVKVTALTGSGKRITIRNSSQSIVAYKDVTAVGDYELEFTYTTGDTLAVFVTGSTAATGSITVDEVMARLASDTDATYEPYAMTNQELTAAVFKKRDLTSADNLNDIIESGIYSATSSPTNTPENRSWYTLIVDAQSDASIRQMILSGGNAIYLRSMGGSPAAWGDWYKYTGTAVTQSKAPEDIAVDPEISEEEPEVVKKSTRKSTKKTEEEE